MRSVTFLALFVAAGCGGEPPVPADALESLDNQLDLEPGRWAEVNLIMSAGASVHCAYQTGGVPLDWNVHSHDGGLRILDGGAGASDEIDFAAADDGRYSILWENNAPTAVHVDIAIDIDGDVRLHSWDSE